MIQGHEAAIADRTPPAAFLRSVRLDHDLVGRDVLAAYTVTPQVQAILRRAAQALSPASADRAWTITGPYGTGKSACGLFLAQLAEYPSVDWQNAWSLLQMQLPGLAHEFQQALGAYGGLLPVAVTMRRAPIATCLQEALLAVLERLPDCPEREALAAEIRTDLRTREYDTRRLLDRVVKLIDLANATGPYRGVLIILDELGKALEHAAYHDSDDIYVLQELAEVAQRSNGRPIFVIGILHRSFDNYAAQLDPLTRDEWGKVQGRFADLAFLEPPEQLIRLAGQAVGHLSSDLGVSVAVRSAAELLADALATYSLAPRNMNLSEFRDIATSAAPLHPLVLVALPYLFRRLAQNERSMFVYLSGEEPFGLQDIARNRAERFIRLPDLYDYCTANIGGLLAGQLVSRHWIEIGDAIDRGSDLTEHHVQVLKTVGVLGILGEFSHLKATQEAICLALDNTPFAERTRVVLEELRARSFLTFRRYDGTYRIWEGSDIDVEERLEEGRRRTGHHLDLATTLSRYLPQRPVVARRHSYETGAIRYFEVQYLQSPTAPTQLQPATQADGVVALCIPDSQSHAEAFRQWAADPSADWPASLVIVVPLQLRGLREAAAELRALNWVWDNTPELRDDRVARRELAERTILAEQSLNRMVELLLDPRTEPHGNLATWFYGGVQLDVKNLTSAKQFLSTVMDRRYHASPRIHNELVNRRSLSSSAAAARRTLIDRMLGQSSQRLLGMDGYPPERSMYESVLLDTGLHREEDAIWTFGPPPPTNPRRLRPVWDEMHRIVFNPSSEPVAVDQLFIQLQAAPYGVMPGVLPILLAAFLLSYPDETSLYREGRFVPEPAIPDFEVLIRRPELFAIAGSRIEGERAAVVQRFARSLDVRPSIVPVVRALIRGVRSLPDTSWRTRRLSAATAAVRRAFEQGASPERLLFADLPNAIGEAPFTDDAVTDPDRIERFFTKLNEALAEWSEHAPRQVAWARDDLLQKCGLPPGSDGWRDLVDRAKGLIDQPIHSSLVPFVKRLAAPGDDRAVLDSVLALVAGKPPRSWLDAEVDQYPARAQEFGERFRLAYEALAPLALDEVEAAKALTVQLRATLSSSRSRRVARSALVALLAELSEQRGGED